MGNVSSTVRRKLNPEDRRLVRELMRARNDLRKKLMQMDDQLLDLMAERDALLEELELVNLPAIAEKFGVSVSHIQYIGRPRSSSQI